MRRPYTVGISCPHCRTFHYGRSYIDEAQARTAAQRVIEECRQARIIQFLPDETEDAVSVAMEGSPLRGGDVTP